MKDITPTNKSNPDWVVQQLNAAVETVRAWPPSKKKAAGIRPEHLRLK